MTEIQTRTVFCIECRCERAVKVSAIDGQLEFLKLHCGHTKIKGAVELATDEELDFSFDNGDKLRPFQREFGVRFIEQAGGRCLVNFEMGLGKTIVAFGYLYVHPEALPAIWIMKASLIQQLSHELVDKLGVDGLSQVITSGSDKLHPKLKHFILSYDTLWRLSDKQLEKIRERVNTVIIDECQLIKDMTAKRTKGVHRFVSGFDNVIALSGTPIKNNAKEFFSILHLLRPDRFPNLGRFMDSFVDYYQPAGSMYFKIGGIRKDRVEAFQAYTKDFIIRKTRAEVLPELPPVDRTFLYVDPDISGNLTDMYDAAYDDFESRLMAKIAENRDAAFSAVNLLAMMTKLRHVVGLMKVRAALEYLTQFLLETDRQIIVFCHHKDVADMLQTGVNQFLAAGGYPLAEYIAPGFDGHAILDRMRNDPMRRVAIASQMHGGEGYNMQFASDILMAERQWNPANEVQCENRICRIGQTAKYLSAPYLTAVGTIDDYFTEIVERKRHNLAITFGEEVGDWDENSIMKELAEKLLSAGKPKWTL